MSKLITISLAILFTLNGFSQSNTSNEIIAEGGAKTKVRPDIATFTLTLEKRDTNERTAIMLLNKEVDQLVNSLNLVGFRNDNIKIANYDVSSSTDNGNSTKIYTASNVLKLNFKIDNTLIDAFYSELQKNEIQDLDISFETNLSDSLERNTRLKLLQQAIEDAKINALHISRTVGVLLGKVKQVQKYGQALDDSKIEMIKFTRPIIKEDKAVVYKTAFDKFQVEDVDLEEKITIIYEIKN